MVDGLEISKLILKSISLISFIYLSGYLLSSISLKNEKNLDLVDKIFIQFLTGFLFIGVLGLSLAILGLFSLKNLILLLIIFYNIFYILIFKSTFVCDNLLKIKYFKINIKKLYLDIKNEYIYLIIIVSVSLFLFLRPFHWIVGGEDPGVYINTGIHIAKSGSIFVHDTFLGNLNNDLKQYFYQIETREFVLQESKYKGLQFPGFYIIDTTHGKVVPQFYYLYPIWIAIFYSFFGLVGSLYTTPFISTLSVIAIYLLGKRLFNTKVGLVASTLLMFNFSQVWFSRYPCSEILSQFLVLSGMYMYILYINKRSKFFGILSALCFGELFLTRIDSYIYLLPITIAAIYGQIRLGRVNVLAFLIPFLVIYFFASGIAFFISSPYTVDILRLNLKLLRVVRLETIQLFIFLVYPILTILTTLAIDKFRIKDLVICKIRRYLMLLCNIFILIVYLIIVVRYYISMYLGIATNLYFVSIYLAGCVGIFIASIGFLLLVKYSIEKRDFATFFVMIMFITDLALWTYLHRGTISISRFYSEIVLNKYSTFPSRPVWFRYYLPLVVPCLIICLAYLVGRLLNSSRKLHIFCAIIVLILVLIPSLAQDIKIINYIDYKGSINSTKNIAQLLDDSSLVIYKYNYFTDKISLPLYHIYDINIRPLYINDANELGNLLSKIIKYSCNNKKIYIIDFFNYDDIFYSSNRDVKVFKITWVTLYYHISWKNYYNYIFIPSEPHKETHMLTITEISPNKEFIIPIKGWYGLELWNNISTRWISNNATVLIYSPQESVSILSFKVLSFYKPRTLQIYLNDKLIYEQKIPTKFVKLNIPIKLKKGENIIKFYTPDGCQRPCDIPELKNRDSRCLSLAFQNISLVKINSVKFIDVGSRSARIYLSSGWSGDEKWDNTNITFVWAEGSKSVVLLPLQNKSGLNLTIKCLPFIYDKNITQEMNIYFNGHFVDRLALKPGWNEYTVAISENFTKIGINLLEFRYKYAESPKDHGINNDTRKLAVAFDWIMINQRPDNSS